MKKLLLCPPRYFDIQYEINPWMKKHITIDQNLVQKQYTDLKELYSTLSIPFFEITPQTTLCDQVYTTDTGHAEGMIFIQSNFRYKERRPESQIVADFLEKKGYTIHHIPSGIFFEGQGDFVRNTNAYFLGYGKRSMKEATPYLETILQKPVIPIELPNPYFYHLDTCFSSLSTEVAMIYEKAFTDEGVSAIRQHFQTVISIDQKDAQQFACNLIIYNNDLILNAGISDSLKRELTSFGFDVHTTDLSEYLKGGGSAKCISLQLYD